MYLLVARSQIYLERLACLPGEFFEFGDLSGTDRFAAPARFRGSIGSGKFLDESVRHSVRVHTERLNVEAQPVLVGQLDLPLRPQTVQSPGDPSDVGKIGFDTGRESALTCRRQSALRCSEPFGELVALEFKFFEGETGTRPLILSL